MARAIDILMNEHRIIEAVLGSLKSFVDGLRPGQAGGRERLAAYARFFREFADRCHHGKEEDGLFAVMGEHGFPRDAGPIFVMLQEHDAGRKLVRQLADVGEGGGNLSEEEVARTRASAHQFIALLAGHIQKEDAILYPAAVQMLPEEVLGELERQFEAFEETKMGHGEHERLHALAEELTREFSPTDRS